MTKRIIIAVILFLIASSLVMFYVLNTFEKNSANAQKRTENDFTTENFVIDQIWERQLVKNKGITNKEVIKSYIFIKPRNEEFNLRFSESDAFGSEKNKNKILSQIREGDTISAKVIIKQLEDARKGGILNWIKRFIQGDKREVAIYKLVNNRATVSESDNNSFDVIEMDFMDSFTRTVTIFGIILGGLIIYIVSYIRRKRIAKQQNL